MAETINLNKVTLKAGQLDLFYENGSVRWISLGNTEIVRMIYSAVRDHNWGTIEPVILEQNVTISEASFEITLKVEYRVDPIHSIADYRIKGSSNNIRFEMKGTAQSEFLKNRIGFCILHPIKECAGKTARVIHSDGNLSEFIFPEVISPLQPVKNIQSLIWEPAPGINARLNMMGDVFEMEDQRNWTDASYKTYCTPLELPFPARIQAGESITQVVELSVEAPEINTAGSSDFTFSWNQNIQYPLPILGTAISSRKEELTQQETDLLVKLPLNHLRVEIRMFENDFTCILEKAVSESEKLEWPLFVVLYLSENHQEEYRRFTIICKGLNAFIGWILPIGPNHLPMPVFDQLYTQIKQDFPHAMVGTGVNAYFAELNRARPSIKKADFVSFTISPQVHAFDDASLVENLEAQTEVIRSAKALFPQKPVFVSPVSLRQRFNVVATAAEPSPLPGQLLSSVDIRQRTNFAARWTLGSLKYLAQAGAELVTYYETVGWKGWIQGEQAPVHPKLFPAMVNEIFPVYKAFKELTGYSTVIQSTTSQPLIFDGLVVTSGKEIKILIFNFTEDTIEVSVQPPILPKRTNSLIHSSVSQYVDGKCILEARDLIVITI